MRGYGRISDINSYNNTNHSWQKYNYKKEFDPTSAERYAKVLSRQKRQTRSHVCGAGGETPNCSFDCTSIGGSANELACLDADDGPGYVPGVCDGTVGTHSPDISKCVGLGKCYISLWKAPININ